MSMERIVAFTSTLLAVTPSYCRDRKKRDKKAEAATKQKEEGGWGS